MSSSIDYFEEDLSVAAQWFVEQMAESRVFTFSGEMGSGKTTLIKEICKLMEVKETVSSPSFALVYEYFSPVHGTIYHFDLYRIKDISELYDIGYEDYVFSGNYCFIEWPEIAAGILPETTRDVRIKINKDNSRNLSFAG